MLKVRVNLSLTPDTAERLEQYAWDNHLSGASAAVTELVWKAKVTKGSIPGQMTFADVEYEVRKAQKKGKTTE